MALRALLLFLAGCTVPMQLPPSDLVPFKEAGVVLTASGGGFDLDVGYARLRLFLTPGQHARCTDLIGRPAGIVGRRSIRQETIYVERIVP